VTQARSLPEARQYVARRVSEGKTKREAHRALRRYIIWAVWRLWRDCTAVSAELHGLNFEGAAENKKRTAA
jgi:hypothetical protein